MFCVVSILSLLLPAIRCYLLSPPLPAQETNKISFIIWRRRWHSNTGGPEPKTLAWKKPFLNKTFIWQIYTIINQIWACQNNLRPKFDSNCIVNKVVSLKFFIISLTFYIIRTITDQQNRRIAYGLWRDKRDIISSVFLSHHKTATIIPSWRNGADRDVQTWDSMGQASSKLDIFYLIFVQQI